MSLKLDVVVRTPWCMDSARVNRLRAAVSDAVIDSRVTIITPNHTGLAEGFDASTFAPPDVIMTLGKPVAVALKNYADRFRVPRISVEATPNGDVQKSYFMLPDGVMSPQGSGLLFAGSFYTVDTHKQMFDRLFQSISKEKLMRLGDVNRELFGMSTPFNTTAVDLSPDGLNASYHQLLDERRFIASRLKSMDDTLASYSAKSSSYAERWDERAKLLGQLPVAD